MLHPILSFPPRVQWHTTAQMLQEVFQNARATWSQDFLLRTTPLADLQLLASPGNLSRAVAFTFKVRLDGASHFVVDVVSLCVPTTFVGQSIAGISVESSAPEGELQLAEGDIGRMQMRSDFLTHFVMDTNTATNLQVGLDRKFRTAAVRYYCCGTSRKVHANLTFQHDAFLAAFNKHTGKIDYACLESALIVADVAEIDCESPRAVSLLPKTTGDSMLIEGGQFPPAIRRFVALGNHHSSVVRATYNNRCPVLLGPMYFQTSCNDGAYMNVVEQLSSWAITDRASLIVPVIPSPLELPDFVDEPISSEDSRISEEVAMLPVNNSLGHAVQIAPRPQRDASKKLSFAEEMDARRLEKLDTRKQRNRESAKRSYALKQRQLQRSRRI